MHAVYSTVQYNITLLPSVNTLTAQGMFCGAKYTRHTFTPIIKHLITTANKHPGKCMPTYSTAVEKRETENPELVCCYVRVYCLHKGIFTEGYDVYVKVCLRTGMMLT